MKTSYLTAFSLMLASGAVFSERTTPYCAETIIQVDIDQVTDLGFSGRDLLNLSRPERTLDWAWEYKLGTTQLTLSAQSSSRTARYIDSVAVYPDGVSDVAIVCPNRVEVDAWVTFSTTDDAFNERWHTVLSDTDGTDCRPETGDLCLAPGHEATFTYGFSREGLNGSFYNEIVVPEDHTINFYAEGKFTVNAASANVFGQAYSCADDICNSYYVHGGRTPEGAGPIR